MGNNYSVFVKEIEKVAETMTSTVKAIEKGIKDLAGITAINKAIEEIDKVSDLLDQEEKDALKQIADANKCAGLALHYGKVAVRDVKEITNVIVRVLNAEGSSNRTKVELAIKTYIRRMEGLIPSLEKARDHLAEAVEEMKKAALSLNHLENWCDRKMEELNGKKEGEIVKQRSIAYSGAASVTMTLAGAVVAINLWNPIGWIATAAAIGAGAAITMTVSVGVTEGATVEELKNLYNVGKEQIQKTSKVFDEMSEVTADNVKLLQKKRDELVEITAVAKGSVSDGKDALEIDVDDIMLNTFKENATNLDKLCEDYLKTN